MSIHGRTPAMLALLGACSIAACGAPDARPSSRCEPEQISPAEAWRDVKTIAVFPPDNWTYEIGPEYVTWYRAVLHELLRRKGYDVAPLAKINRFMTRNRFVMAGEARTYSTEELAHEFNADALFFWDIVEFEKSSGFWDALLDILGFMMFLVTFDFDEWDEADGDEAEFSRNVQVICGLVHKNGTLLWSSGLTCLDLPYAVQDSDFEDGAKGRNYGWMSITLGEILRQIPERR
ncbi:MAG: hypothetical protein HYY16_08305 [Planctomycetes bacterium]|nr:hypothetical protein [Planctomycetota bacterium]